MKVRSLSKAILGIVLVAQLLCAVVLSLSALLHERHTHLKAFDEALRGRSDSLLGAIQDSEDESDRIFVDPRELKLPSNDFYAVYNVDGSLVGASQNAPTSLLDRRSNGYRNQKTPHDIFRVYQSSAMRIIDRAESHGVGLRRPVVMVYASSAKQVQREILEAARFYVFLILTLVICTGLSVVFLVRRALRPLNDFADATSRLSAASLVFAPPRSVMQIAELRPLAEILSAVIQSLRHAFEKERRFVGDAAHELKTGVTVVRSTVQVQMLKPRTVDEHVAGLQRILEDTNRVEQLVSQMLSSSEVDDALSDQSLVTDLSRSIASTLSDLSSVAIANGIHLNQTESVHASVKLNQERASVLISNLVMNAIQHSQRGMSVTVSLETAPPDLVILQVIDTGAGISPEALPHIFERFFREDRSRSRETGGAGLGLAICKSIVESANGKIEVESQLQVGTKITVTFPKA